MNETSVKNVKYCYGCCDCCWYCCPPMYECVMFLTNLPRFMDSCIRSFSCRTTKKRGKKESGKKAIIISIYLILTKEVIYMYIRMLK